MLYNPFRNGKILYDQRQEGIGTNYAIYNTAKSSAYYSRNINDTFINEQINKNTLSSSLINKKHLININTNKTNTSSPVIGTDLPNFKSCSYMAIYKFLGFKEALTEEQIQAVIKKYNLLDGVDEIEVS